jgi:hypothetical protein
MFDLLLFLYLIGAFVHACQKVGRHIVVLEDNEAIYKSVLQPLILELLIHVFKKQWLESKDANVDFEEEEELPIHDIVQNNPILFISRFIT